jgi:plasmid stabilization system protein ParE
MSFNIIWQPNSETTYYDEIDFLFLKWNLKEVLIFQELVNQNLERLLKNPKIGVYKNNLKVYSIVISKQTTLFYNFDESTKTIDLYAFWNNYKNPSDLNKLL